METTQLPDFIEGETGALEYDFILGKTDPRQFENYIAIACHPHPLHGGTMNNKVVHTLCRAWRDIGMDSLRFNFRGVGKSEGVFDEGQGELKDLLAVLRFIRTHISKDKNIVIAGFSFGAYIAAKYASTNKPAALVLIAPPVSYPEFAQMTRFPCPVLLVQGDQDEVVAYAEVQAWAGTLVKSPEFHCIKDASHFFHGKLPALKQIIQTFSLSLLER